MIDLCLVRERISRNELRRGRDTSGPYDMVMEYIAKSP